MNAATDKAARRSAIRPQSMTDIRHTQTPRRRTVYMAHRRRDACRGRARCDAGNPAAQVVQNFLLMRPARLSPRQPRINGL